MIKSYLDFYILKNRKTFIKNKKQFYIEPYLKVSLLKIHHAWLNAGYFIVKPTCLLTLYSN